MSPEMKDLMQKRGSARAAREREIAQQQKAADEDARANAEMAWKFWLQKKNEKAKEKKKTKDEDSKEEKEKVRSIRSKLSGTAVHCTPKGIFL